MHTKKEFDSVVNVASQINAKLGNGTITVEYLGEGKAKFTAKNGGNTMSRTLKSKDAHDALLSLKHKVYND